MVCTQIRSSEVVDAVATLLSAIGENREREGLIDTPTRVANMLRDEILCGYQMDPADILSRTFADEKHQEMVVVGDIPLYSLCEHHLLPFIGKAHVAYIPNGKVVGISKLVRLVNCFSRRLQIQERLTSQVADAICQHLNPLGVAVVIEAEHLCMAMRGVRTPGSVTTTSAVRGLFSLDDKARSEFMSLISRRKA